MRDKIMLLLKKYWRFPVGYFGVLIPLSILAGFATKSVLVGAEFFGAYVLFGIAFIALSIWAIERFDKPRDWRRGADWLGH